MLARVAAHFPIGAVPACGPPAQVWPEAMGVLVNRRTALKVAPPDPLAPPRKDAPLDLGPYLPAPLHVPFGLFEGGRLVVVPKHCSMRVQ